MLNFKKFVTLSVLCFFTNVCMADFDSTIPVVDMNDFHSPTRHKLFIQDLQKALSTVGFVAITNSGVDIKTLDEAYAASKKFYAAPLEFKMQGYSAKLSGQRGYVPGETAKGNTVKDHKEFYHIGREYSEATKTKYNYVSNIWPANDGGFKPAMQKLIVALDKHIAVMEQAISESMGEKPNFLSNMTNEGTYLMRCIHYPAKPPANSIWAAAHTDIDLFTILPRATADGLQVLNANGRWVNVVVPDNAFILNAGDMLQNLTNGVYRSARHRVISQDEEVERYSIIAFVHPRPTDNLGPLDKFVKQVGKRKFADATQHELLSERLVDLGLNSPELLQGLAKSGVMDRLIDVGRASPGAMRTLSDNKLASPKVLAALNKLDAETKEKS